MRHHVPRGRRLETARRGGVVIIFMVSLVLMMLATLALIRTTLMHRDIVRSNQLRMQARWLMHSGVGRAAERARSNPDYSGETWTIPPDESGLTDVAQVEIAVAPVDDDATRRTLTITVNFPADSPQRARLTESYSLKIPSS